MRAWVVRMPGPIESGPLQLVEREPPVPGRGEVRVRITACGVCRTDLHIAEGDLPARRSDVVPGHEVVGFVDEIGEGAGRFALGDRVGIAWLRATCGRCRFCRAGRENLCKSPRFTGYDDDGGYAEYAVVPEAYAYSIPVSFDDERAAPLLCAGIVGYRALKRAMLPPGGALGVFGFGASAHLAAQVAASAGARVHVVTRSARARALAREVGATSASAPQEGPPERLDAAILFAPTGDLVPVALRALERGGRLAIAGIHLTAVPPLDYERDLFYEREVCSVTANTRSDGEEFLAIADRIGLHVATTPFALADAPRALEELAHGRVRGAAVLASA